jgi:hypothetical protein
MEKHIEWLKALATPIQHIIKSSNIYEILENLINETSNTYTKTKIIRDTILNTDYKYIILTDDPHQYAEILTDKIITYENTKKTGLFKPIIIMTKIYKKEYAISFNNTRIIYLIQTPIINESIISSMIYKHFYNVKTYFNYDINTLTTIINTTEYTDNISGGKNKQKKINININTKDIRIKITGFINDYISNLSYNDKSFIYITDDDDISYRALDLIYTSKNIKNVLISEIKKIVNKNYPDYSIKEINHFNFYVPGDFRLKKFSIYIENKNTKIFILNLYNSGIYEPIPSYIDTKNNIIRINPLARLRFLYIDLFYLDGINDVIYKGNIIRSIQKYKTDILYYTNTNAPIWVGYYRDETYDNNKYNQRLSVQNLFETII